MKLQKAIEVLKHHNAWRKGHEIKMTDSNELTESIESAINILENLK